MKFEKPGAINFSIFEKRGNPTLLEYIRRFIN